MNKCLQILAAVALVVGCDVSQAADIEAAFDGQAAQPAANQTKPVPVSLIQSGDWKLMEFLEDGRLELYNLRDDIGETKNLANVMPDKAKELHDRLLACPAESSSACQ
jgi:hypothetical protein